MNTMITQHPPASRKSRKLRNNTVVPHSRWLLFQTAALWTNLLVIVLFRGTASAAELRPETLEAWEVYVAEANASMQERLRFEHSFISSDEDQSRAAKLRRGEILVSPAGSHVPKRVPSGLIHHWKGEIFVPNSMLQDVLRIVRDYGCYKEIYKPDVIDSRTLATAESEDQFHMLLMNKSMVSKTALDSDFRSSYFRVNEHRCYSVSASTRIQELAAYGTDVERMLPEDKGTGLIWRTYSITRFEERDGGVYIEQDAMVLSRDIPVLLSQFVNPIVRRVSREAVMTSLRQTQDAVRSAAELGENSAFGRFVDRKQPTCQKH
jgi:hypothetical protein